MSGTTFTWADFAKAATAEEIAGLGPEDPLADLAVIGTGLAMLWANSRAVPDTVRVSRTRDPDFCLVGPYGTIKDACKAAEGETHHIVPDMVYRLGNRPTGADESSSVGRIPNSPTFNGGMSICLTTGEHRTDEDAVHRSLNPAINALGTASPTPGTAPMPQLLAASTTALQSVRGVSAACKQRAIAATAAQAAPTLGQPGRATTGVASPDARRVLAQGHY